MIKLPSGAELQITLSPFSVGKELFKTCSKDLVPLRLDMNAHVDGNFYKDVFLTLVSSDNVEKCVWKCMERCLYNKQRITEDTFESEEARGDYLDVMFEVAKANIMPFTKHLYARYSHILDLIKFSQS